MCEYSQIDIVIKLVHVGADDDGDSFYYYFFLVLIVLRMFTYFKTIFKKFQPKLFQHFGFCFNIF